MRDTVDTKAKYEKQKAKYAAIDDTYDEPMGAQ